MTDYTGICSVADIEPRRTRLDGEGFGVGGGFGAGGDLGYGGGLDSRSGLNDAVAGQEARDWCPGERDQQKRNKDETPNRRNSAG